MVDWEMSTMKPAEKKVLYNSLFSNTVVRKKKISSKIHSNILVLTAFALVGA